MSKLGGAGDRFGDYFCVDCAKLPSVGGHYPFKNTTFTIPITNMSKSTDKGGAAELGQQSKSGTRRANCLSEGGDAVRRKG